MEVNSCITLLIACMQPTNKVGPVRVTHLGIDHLCGPSGFGEEWESLLNCIPLLHLILFSILKDMI